jgi:GNAT superfamily N-acetyltransferase
MRIEVIRLPKDQYPHYFSELANLRMKVFRDFPYLYDGTIEYEKKYLEVYGQSQRSVLIVAKADDHVIGVSTAIPLSDETVEAQKPFLQQGFDVREVFYFGESVLDPNYRGQGIGHRFFDLREQAMQDFGGFRFSTFCAVQRDQQHPLRPPTYRPLDQFWQKRGYVQRPDLVAYFSWKEIHEQEESKKPLIYWLKEWR